MSNNDRIISIDEIIAEIAKARPEDPSFNIENVIYAGKTEEMRKVIDQVFIQNGFGAVKSGISRSLYGINFAGTPNMMPINRDNYGYTFFTKPLMNMSTPNLRGHRILSQLLNKDESSIHRLIRCSLDAGLTRGANSHQGNNFGFTSPFVNPKSPWIPILSNNLLSMSGWPDYDAQTFTSQAGNWREEYSFVDGVVQDFRAWDATCSFRNVDGNIITMLFFYWLLYQAGVAAVGDLIPYPHMNLSNEVDYNTAIYRITLDSQRTRITGIARTIAYPITCPIGAQFNFESDRVFNDDTRQISIQFRCMGAEYNDDILIYEFNKAQEIMDPDFRGYRRDNNYVLLPKSAWRVFNGLSVPRINPDTYEFEWWVPTEIYIEQAPLLKQKIMDRGIEVPITEQVKQLNGRNNKVGAN